MDQSSVGGKNEEGTHVRDGGKHAPLHSCEWSLMHASSLRRWEADTLVQDGATRTSVVTLAHDDFASCINADHALVDSIGEEARPVVHILHEVVHKTVGHRLLQQDVERIRAQHAA